MKFCGCYDPFDLLSIALVNIRIDDVVFARQNALWRVGMGFFSDSVFYFQQHSLINQVQPSINKFNSGQYKISKSVDGTLNAFSAGLLLVFFASAFFVRR